MAREDSDKLIHGAHPVSGRDSTAGSARWCYKTRSMHIIASARESPLMERLSGQLRMKKHKRKQWLLYYASISIPCIFLGICCSCFLLHQVSTTCAQHYTPLHSGWELNFEYLSNAESVKLNYARQLPAANSHFRISNQLVA